MSASQRPAPDPAEFERRVQAVVRGSRAATLLSVLGLVAVLGALLFSGRALARMSEQRAGLDAQIRERQAELRQLTDSLVRTREAFSAYAAVVERERPELAGTAAEVARDSAAAARVVYIQFGGAVPRATAEGVRARLNESGYHAPGVERIERGFRSSARFFHAEDAAAAAELARRASAFFAERGCAADFPVQDLSTRGLAAPRGQLELWIAVDCPALGDRGDQAGSEREFGWRRRTN